MPPYFMVMMGTKLAMSENANANASGMTLKSDTPGLLRKRALAMSKNSSRDTYSGPTHMLRLTEARQSDVSTSALGSLIFIRKDPNVYRLASSFGVWLLNAF